MTDYTDSLPDNCLALIFNFLTTTNDRNNSSLVSKRWLGIEAQTRTHLTLNARSDLRPFIKSMFTRFNSLTQLVLRDDYSSPSMNDEDLILIISMCKKLKKFSCIYCAFTDLGMFESLQNCSQLEVLSITKLHNSRDVEAPAKFRAGLAVKTLKVIELRHVSSERLVEPLISGAKNLKCLKLIWCAGKWDGALKMIPDDSSLVEVHLEKVYVTDGALSLLSKCRDLNSLCILDLNTLGWTNAGFISVAKSCKGLKKLYVGCWNNTRSQIGDKGLIAVGEHSMNLEELVLVGVGATCVSLEVIASNCKNLVRLELSTSETITDVEMMCIAENCVALKILCIEECHGVSDEGIEACALGCPNLAKIRVSKCKNVTREVKDRLISRRGGQNCMQTVNAITSDSGVQEHVEEVPPAANDVGVTGPKPVSTSSTSSRNGHPSSNFKESS